MQGPLAAAARTDVEWRAARTTEEAGPFNYQIRPAVARAAEVVVAGRRHAPPPWRIVGRPPPGRARTTWCPRRPFGKLHGVGRGRILIVVLGDEGLQLHSGRRGLIVHGLVVVFLLDSCIIQHLYSMIKSYIFQEIENISLPFPLMTNYHRDVEIFTLIISFQEYAL
jgi:hypothetical protein